jgi:hypothetical protein
MIIIKLYLISKLIFINRCQLTCLLTSIGNFSIILEWPYKRSWLITMHFFSRSKYEYVELCVGRLMCTDSRKISFQQAFVSCSSKWLSLRRITVVCESSRWELCCSCRMLWVDRMDCCGRTRRRRRGYSSYFGRLSLSSVTSRNSKTIRVSRSILTMNTPLFE